MAHTGRYNEGTWIPLTYDQIAAIAHDTDAFSNAHHGLTAGGTYDRVQLPPIHNDPPEHHPIRRAILPFFGPKQVQGWEPAIAAHCDRLARAVAARGTADAAVDYAQHIPVGAIASILGLPESDGDQFRDWIHQFIEVGGRIPEVRVEAEKAIISYMAEQMADRRRQPRHDLISHLVTTQIDGEPLPDEVIERILVLMLVAGIDTTWSSIGAAMWHLATHPEDRRRLVREPELIPTAVEEFLRAYAPVNVVRAVVKDSVIDGVKISPGDSVMMAFPIACRDEAEFEHADQVLIDRARNRHIAFGIGIHRCLGSNLARLEMKLAIEAWLRHVPDFELAPGSDVRWSEGQIRGPRSIPIRVL